MSEIKTYQPWSIPLLHTTLPDKLSKELIQLTDLITEDKDRESNNESLAGEIEDEWIIDPILLTNISFKDNIIQLRREYFKRTMYNYHIEDNAIPRFLVVFKNVLDNIEIVSSWFNNQKDTEYNPTHNHGGILSGVLYLKIPEYLSSKKMEGSDGSITFIGNDTAAEGMISNSILTISPKVGDIFLFSSVLKHQVYPFRSVDGKGIRRSMSFNLDSKREYYERPNM